MSHLIKIIKSKNLNQRTLAKMLKRDVTTINRWVNNTGKISFGNAEKIAIALNKNSKSITDNISPVEILLNREKSKIKFYINTGCEVRTYSHERKFAVPFTFRDYHKVRVESFTHERGSILFFNYKPLKINDFERYKRYLVHTKNKIYYGIISFDQSPYTGEVKITDIANCKTIDIGSCQKVDKIYEFVGQVF